MAISFSMLISLLDFLCPLFLSLSLPPTSGWMAGATNNKQAPTTFHTLVTRCKYDCHNEYARHLPLVAAALAGSLAGLSEEPHSLLLVLVLKLAFLRELAS